MKLKDFDFRIWDNTEKRYLNEIELHKYDKYPVEAGTTFTETDRINEVEFVKNKNDLEIELFTGLYDKKDKKVYENDIVKVKSLYDYFLAKISIHKEGTFYFEGKNGDYIGSLIYLVEDEGYTIEIIGNIHENPELLKC
ncbi:YopX family protein [Campylobacter coli]